MKKEQKQLLDKAIDSLEAAEILFNQGYYGICVSRTYYSMLYIAKAFLLKLNLSFSEHSAIIYGFGKEFINNNKINNDFYKYLVDAQNLKNVSDYDLDVQVSEEEAKTELKKAKDFIELARKKL